MSTEFGFSNFDGETFALTGVDFGSVKVERWTDMEDASTCRFRLNGQVYAAIEDPSDGYRSHLGEIQLLDPTTEFQNVFPAHNVYARHITERHRDYGAYDDSETYEVDILEFVDARTHEVVLEIGTDHADDYYPSFVANFRPENLLMNFTGELPSEEIEVEPEPEEPEISYADNPAYGAF